MCVVNASLSLQIISYYLQRKRSLASALSMSLAGICVLFIVLTQSPVFAQNDGPAERGSFGAFGDYGFIQHTADFRAIPGFPNCCPQFTTGTGKAPDFGIYYKFPLGSDVYFYLRAGYIGYGATLTAREGTTVIDTSGTPVAGSFDHTITTSLGSIGLEPMFGINVLGNLMVRLGGRVGYVITKTFSQKEVLTDPASFGVFTDTRTRIRNEFDNQVLPNASTIEGSLLAGLSYELPLNTSSTLHAVPEAYYSLGITQITKDLTWRANAIRVGLGIEYTPPAYEPTPVETKPATPVPQPAQPSVVPVIPPLPLAPVRKPDLGVTIAAVGVDRNGNESPNAKITVEEFRSTRMSPLLNYVFFDENSSMIPVRYKRLSKDEAKNFRIDELYNFGTLETYYELLNIVGRRLKENPSAKITLVGCNSFENKELGNRALSQSRATAVRDYLHQVWEIPNSRMVIDFHDLPDEPSFTTDTDGIAENRRVEIHSSDSKITEPVISSDTMTRITPDMLRFKPNVIAEAGVQSWKLDAMQDNVRLKEFAGTNTIPETLDWSLGTNDEILGRNPGMVTYAMVVTDQQNRQARAEGAAIPVQKVTIEQKRSERVADKEVDHYSLILFAFDKADLTSSNQRTLGYIREHTTPDASVTITGYTDRMGDAEHNQQLAEMRAKEAALALGVRTDAVRGVGKAELLYDNSLPEGRFYCRTVKIDVEKPVKE
jgi:outer membrane protein OmpA-like peptidoglycan-associated protein